MWEWTYGSETIDYKLLWLRVRKKIWLIPAIMLLSALMVMGIHVGYRLWTNDGRLYQATSIFYVDFAENSAGEEYEYFNYYTWGEMIHCDAFIEALQEETGHAYEKSELVKRVTASIEADVRYVYVRCTTNSREESMLLAKAVEKAFPIFKELQKEIAEVSLSEAASTVKDSTNIRGKNAFFLGAVLGIIVSVIGLLLYEAGKPSVTIPITLERRYHYPVFGAPFMKEFKSNCLHFLGDSSRTRGLVYVDVTENPIPIPGLETCTVIQNPFDSEESVDRLKEFDELVIAVAADRRNNKKLDRLIEQINRFRVPIKGMLLVGADEKLVKAYYGEKSE